MRKLAERLATSVLCLGAIAALASCGGSGAKTSAGPMPTAVIVTIGQPFVVAGTGGLTTTVRAGADVVLSAKNSFKGANDTGVPIIDFAWKRIDSGTDPVNLVTRTSNTVSFMAPQVLAATLVKYQLTVTDSNGNASTAEADITVQPLRDADHFLKYEFNDDLFVVNAVTDAVIPAATAGYNVTIPFTVTVTKVVSFTDNGGHVQTDVQVGNPVNYTGGWNASLGNGGNVCNNPLNPGISAHIPSFEVDDVITDPASPYVGQPISNVMQLSDVDLDPANPAIPPGVAKAKISIQFAPVASGDALHVAAPTGVNVLACIGGIGTPAAAMTVSGEDLYVAMNDTPPNTNIEPRDNARTASIYYQTIDPQNTRTNLVAWLTANGFVATAPDYGAAANPATIYHATYTNNYDLGFGRDMYMHVGPCESGYATKALQDQIGHCDVASVVVNYASLEATIKKLNPINAVAMEYTGPSPGVGPRFVKFYTFAPDTRTGAFPRVTSVDLDHRGQKYMPAACTVCHGGTPNTPNDVTTNQYPSTPTITSTPNQTGQDGPSGVYGDVNASFLPWDLDSFLYSDTDPGFSNKPQDAAIKAQYTRANQEAQFKLLNSGTYLTTLRATNSNEKYRFESLRELLEGWYAQGGTGVGLPGSYNGAFVPPGWQETNFGNLKTTATVPGSAKIYTDVYMRHCRTCHVAQAPLDATSPTDPAQCTLTTNDSSTNVGRIDQYPMGCYFGFVQTSHIAALLNQSLMPSSRRTMDRLWADPTGATPKGQELVDNLNAYFNIPGAVNNQNPTPPQIYVAVTPGTAGANLTINSLFGNPLTGCGSNPPAVNCNQTNRLMQFNLQDNGHFSPGVGDLLVNPQWLVCSVAASTSTSCSGGTPYAVVANDPFHATFLLPAVAPPATLNFLLELDSNGTSAVTQNDPQDYQ